MESAKLQKSANRAGTRGSSFFLARVGRDAAKMGGRFYLLPLLHTRSRAASTRAADDPRVGCATALAGEATARGEEAEAGFEADEAAENHQVLQHDTHTGCRAGCRAGR